MCCCEVVCSCVWSSVVCVFGLFVWHVSWVCVCWACVLGVCFVVCLEYASCCWSGVSSLDCVTKPSKTHWHGQEGKGGTLG